MVKEVEFSNEFEVLGEYQPYSNAPDQPLFDGYIEDEGKTLKIVVHSPLSFPSEYKRKLFLYFGNVDFGSRLIDYLKIGETTLDYRHDGYDVTNKEYSFDLSRVLIIPRKIYSTGGTSEITIEMYTYEANFNTDYGSKTLSVPYSINNDVKYEYDKSTDGIYRLVLIDFKPWIPDELYGIGDIVEINDILYMSNINDNNTTTDTSNWELPTDEDILNYSRGTTKSVPDRSFVTDMMISRYAKYKIIRDSLISASFKEYDDKDSYELALLLQNLRERAKYKLISHKAVDAAYALQTLKIASSPQTDTTKIHSYNIKYTT
jgi:hypothetical protein